MIQERKSQKINHIHQAKNKMEEQQRPPTEEEMETFEEAQEDAAEDARADQLEDTNDYSEAYGSPEPEEKMNQHTFLSNAVKSKDTLRVTNLNEQELGRPMFSIRFLLDMEDICNLYLGDMAKQLGIENRVSDYFKQKIINITDSGMSKEGFTSLLNVTRKMDSTRTKVRDNPIQNLKGGKKIK